MYGFIGVHGVNDAIITTTNYLYSANDLINNHFDYSMGKIIQRTLNKFGKDKVFYVDGKLCIVLEGVVYNFADNMEFLKTDSYGDVLAKLFRKYGEDMPLYLNGNYSLTVLDIEQNELYLYTNHTSYKPMYYYMQADKVFYSTDYKWLVSTMKANSIAIDLDSDGAVCLLSHGYMLGDLTLIRGIKKVLPGCCIRFSNGTINIHRYFDYRNIKEADGTYDELLDKAEELFSQAVDRIYKKDDEYDYKHLCTLSGGLDSRSVAFVANALGYKQFFVTMSQSGELDEIVATQIATAFKEKHIVYHLDSSDHLLHINDCVASSGGTITYPGFAHLYSLFQALNLDSYGAIITGEIGDLVFGGDKNYLVGKAANINAGAFSSTTSAEKYLSSEAKSATLSLCNNAYEFFLLNRGFNSACNGWYASYYFTESASPFIDLDFLTFILSVPNQYRMNNKFYIDWMKKHHPEMCNYTWTGTRTKPDASDFTKKMARLKRGVMHKVFGVDYMYAMNPYNTWIKDNKAFYNLVEDSLDKAEHLFVDSPMFSEIIRLIKNEGNITDKLMLTTLTASIELFNINV